MPPSLRFHQWAFTAFEPSQAVCPFIRPLRHAASKLRSDINEPWNPIARLPQYSFQRYLLDGAALSKRMFVDPDNVPPSKRLVLEPCSSWRGLPIVLVSPWPVSRPWALLARANVCERSFCERSAIFVLLLTLTRRIFFLGVSPSSLDAVAFRVLPYWLLSSLVAPIVGGF